MGTQLQDIYDSFIVKTENEDFTYKQDLIFQYFKAAIGYSYKTIPYDLTYVLNNDIVFIVNQIATKAGNITINVNTDAYSIPILVTDSLTSISDKIVSAIGSAYIVKIDYSNTYPILTITKSDLSIITGSFVDTDKTGIIIYKTQTYDGFFNETLFQDSIELLSLYMKREYYRKIVAKYEKIKKSIGTKDFDALNNMTSDFKTAQSALADISDEISSFRQEFYSYAN